MENRIDLTDFLELLQTLENSETSIKARTLGGPWIDFSKIILLSDSAMILQDASEMKRIVYIRNIIEFQVDRPVSGLAVLVTYQIDY